MLSNGARKQSDADLSSTNHQFEFYRTKSISLIDPNEMISQMSPPKYDELPVSWRNINLNE